MEPIKHKTFQQAEIERDLLIKKTGQNHIITQTADSDFICKVSANPKNETINNIEPIVLHPTNKQIVNYFVPLSIGLTLFATSEEITVQIIKLLNNNGALEYLTKINSTIELIGIGIFGMFFIQYLYSVFSKTYYIDHLGIKAAHGILAKDTKLICYKDIQTPTVKRTLVNRIMRTGTLEFSSSGTSSVDMYFENIDSPQEVHDLILMNMQRE